MLMLALLTPSTTSQVTNKADDSYLNIPDEYIDFTDKSAPVEGQQSQLYNDFIHKLYRYDADNLQKFDNQYQHQNIQ